MGIPACSFPEESSEDEGGEEGEEAPPDDHEFPMVTELVEKLLSVDVTEIFSPPRVTVQAEKFGLRVGEACDLTTGWGFRLRSHREAAYRHWHGEAVGGDWKPTVHAVQSAAKPQSRHA